MSLSIVAVLALLLAGQQADPPSRTEGDPTRLAPVDVTGRLAGMSLEDRIDSFVDSVVAPVGRYGPARWRHDVCVGAINFQPAAAQVIVDRVSEVALELGLVPEDPGCEPQVLIVATNDGPATAAGLVERSPRLFSLGGEGMELGPSALARFASNDRPVRWWHMSMPVDADTGGRVIRLPGDGTDLEDQILVSKFVASRLDSATRDNLVRVVIIVDTTRLGETSFVQLADYVAMISMAQIDPEADVTSHNSVLNLFHDPAGTPGLTDWDIAYLKGLYRARLDSVSQISRIGAVERSMAEQERGRQAAD